MVQLREIAPGFQVLDCARLRAAMSPAACLSNFRGKKALACADCPIGAELAAASATTLAPEPGHRRWTIDTCKWHTCQRCQQQAARLIAGALCVSCYNRQREAIVGRNAKGMAPVHTLKHIHRFSATIEANPEAITGAMRRAGRAFSLASLSRTSANFVGYATTADEIRRLVNVILPGARIVECQFSAPSGCKTVDEICTRSSSTESPATAAAASTS